MSTMQTLRDRTRGWDTSMLALAVLMVVTGAVSVAGLLFDERMLGGQPIWAKPLKFSLSIALYAVTWAWLASMTTRARRVVWWGSRAIVALLAVEMMIIVGQAVRGRASHFNNETALDNLLYKVMGSAITAVWVLTFVFTVLVMRSDIADRAAHSAIRLGAAVSLYGIAAAYLMTIPTANQLATIKSGGQTSMIGAHGVGVVDGGPGLPLLGWSTTGGGDLRIPHFVGMHALQALPLLAIGLTLLATRWSALRDELTRMRLVRIGGAFYLGISVLVTWQALRGQSIVDPDMLTLAAFGLLVGGSALAAAWAVRSGQAADQEHGREMVRV